MTNIFLYTNINFQKKCSTKEVTKTPSIYVLFVLLCLSCLVPQVSRVIMLLRLTCPQTSRTLRGLVPHVPQVSSCVLVLHMPHTLRSLVPHVSRGLLALLSNLPDGLHAFVPYLYCTRAAAVPLCLTYFRFLISKVFLYMSCIVLPYLVSCVFDV